MTDRKLIAPNGRPSNLNSIQWDLVRTPAFIAWFGDWLTAYETKDYSGVSKIIDENGEPLVLYHGTNRKFSEFSWERNKEWRNTHFQGNGFYFTADENTAVTYAQVAANQVLLKEEFYAALDKYYPEAIRTLAKDVIEIGYAPAWDKANQEHGGNFFKIANIWEKESGLDVNQLCDFAAWVEGSRIDIGAEDKHGFDNFFASGNKHKLPDFHEEDIKRFHFEKAMPEFHHFPVFLRILKVLRTKSKEKAMAARDKGYDGVIYDGPDILNDKPEYIVYQPYQIKGADGQNNTFSMTNNDIRFEQGGTVKKWDRQLIDLSPAILVVLQKLSDMGCKALIVGGAVRDAILGIDPKDIDIEVYQINYADLTSVLSNFGKVKLQGKSFGVIKFKPLGSDIDYDFSVPRKENKIGIGHKDFAITFDKDMTIEDAALRRDFTFNSLAYDPIENTVYDYFGGVDDLNNKIIRHTSDKFSEDVLRILRAMQFQARFDFTIAPETILLMQEMLKGNEFAALPKERLFDEWMKWAEKGIRHDVLFGFLNDTHLIEYYPELEALKDTPQDKLWHPEGDVEVHTTLCLKRMDEVVAANNITGREKAIIVMAILLHDIGKPATTEEREKNGRMAITAHGHEKLGGEMAVPLLKKMGFDDDLISHIANLVSDHLAGVTIAAIPAESGKVKAVKKLSNRLFPATIQQLLYVMDADSNGRGGTAYKEPTGAAELARIAEEVQVTNKPLEYVLMGRHLIAAGLKPSPKFGDVLRASEDAQESGEFSDVEGGKVWLAKYLADNDYETGGTLTLLAPNGKPSNLPADLYELVRTPAFKAWFGDWENNPAAASKVIDENGEPKILYRGKSGDINENARAFGNLFLSSDELYASSFGPVEQYFVSIKKPMPESDFEKTWRVDKNGVYDGRLSANYHKAVVNDITQIKPLSAKFEDGGSVDEALAAKVRQLHELYSTTTDEAEKERIGKQLFDLIKSELPPEALQAMNDAVANAINKQVTDEQNNLLEMEAKQSAISTELKSIWDVEAKLEYGPEKMELGKKRATLRRESETLTLLITSQRNVVKVLENNAVTSSFTDAKGLEHTGIPNFTKINTKIIDFDEDTILADEVPAYIPFIDEKVFAGKGYLFDSIRISKDVYILAVNGYTEKKGGNNGTFYTFERDTIPEYIPSDAEQGYVLVTLDQLVLINDYYYTKAKAVQEAYSAERTKQHEAYYDRLPEKTRAGYLNQKHYWHSLPNSVKKKVAQVQYEAMSLDEKESLYKPYKRESVKRLVSKLEDNEMWTSFHNMYERFINPAAVMPKPRSGNPEVFQYWYAFRDFMKWKVLDIQVQRESNSEIRKIAEETSFGDSHTSNALLPEYGILVKRQNGTNINPVETEQIRAAWVKVQNTYGSLSQHARAQGLKISHTGDKFVFASKAIGMYVSDMHTIAVSTKLGLDQFETCMGHECAHWIDNTLGKGDSRRYATDDYESTAGHIAFAFRSGMNAKSESKYINATKECFARAMEQYLAITNFGDEAMTVFSKTALQAPRPYFAEESYVSKETFYGTIKPLIEKFLEENKVFFTAPPAEIELEESLAEDITPEVPAVDVPETIAQSAEDIQAEIDILTLSLEYADDEEAAQIQQEIDALKIALEYADAPVEFAKGGRVKSIPLPFPLDEAKKHMVFYHVKEPNILLRKNDFYVWVYATTDNTSKLNNGEYDWQFFAPTSMSVAFQKGYVPPLARPWTKKNQKIYKGSEHMLAMMQGLYEEKQNKVYITMMTVRPAYRRQGLNGEIVKMLRTYFKVPKEDVIFHSPTDDGKAFEAAGKFAEGGNVGNAYQDKVDANLKHMGTPAENWEAVPIIGFQEVEDDKHQHKSMPVFDFSVMQGFTKPATLYPASVAGDSKDAWTNCELCGKNIKNVYWIYDEKDQYQLQVGSECVTHFQEGKSGKENQRAAKILLAKMLDNDLVNLKTVVREKLSKIKTEHSYRGTKKVREWQTLNTGHYTSDRVSADYEIRIKNNLEGFNFDVFKGKHYDYNPVVYGKTINDAILPYFYEQEANPYNPILKRDTETIEKELLSWFSRKGKQQAELIPVVVGLMKAFEYDFEFSSDYLESQKNIE